MTENSKEMTQATTQSDSKEQFNIVSAGRPRLSELFIRLLKFTGTSTFDFDFDGDGEMCLSSAAEITSLYLDDDIVKATSPDDRSEHLLSPVEQLSYVLAQIAQLGLLTEAMKRVRQMSDESETDLLAAYAGKTLEVYTEAGLINANDDSLDGMLWLLDSGAEVILQAYREAGGLGEVSVRSESKAAGSGTGFPLGIGTLRGGVGADERQGAEEAHIWTEDNSDCICQMRGQISIVKGGDEARCLDAHDNTCCKLD